MRRRIRPQAFIASRAIGACCHSELMSKTKEQVIRILLVDDHAVIRTALRMVIQNQAGMTMVGEAGSSAAALDLAARERPDIILLDVDLGGENGLDFIPELLAACPCRVIVLTGVRDPEVHYRAVKLGAMGLVQKERAVDVLIDAIQRVHAGEAWLDPSLTARVLSEVSTTGKNKKNDPEETKIASLTDREREVLTLISEGLKNKEIADRLFISEWTVRHHITSIFSKLEVSDRVELILYAYRQGLATPPRH
jgi:DNA-binding NarL/FixJ family response regulator